MERQPSHARKDRRPALHGLSRQTHDRKRRCATGRAAAQLGGAAALAMALAIRRASASLSVRGEYKRAKARKKAKRSSLGEVLTGVE